MIYAGHLDAASRLDCAMDTVLIIDDDETTRNVLEALLTRAGFKVYLANSGEEGVRVFRSERVGVALVDIVMPDKDGLETIMDIRRGAPEARIIAMTGQTSIGRTNPLSWASRLGAKKCLRKPFSSGELLTTVSQVLSNDPPDRPEQLSV